MHGPGAECDILACTISYSLVLSLLFLVCVGEDSSKMYMLVCMIMDYCSLLASTVLCILLYEVICLSPPKFQT